MNNKKITDFIFIAILFCVFNFTVSAQPIEILFTSATDTLTQAEVNAKLDEYDIDELEANGFIAVIDNGTVIDRRAFWGHNTVSQYLVNVIAPNVTTIGVNSFGYCTNLVSVDFPVVTTIENVAFVACINLISVDFPLVTNIGRQAFVSCVNLVSANFPLAQNIGLNAFATCFRLTTVSFGTGFESETEINFGVLTFNETPTTNIDLVLGEFVLPLRDGNEWNGYIWKSINYVGVEEVIKNHTVNISPNPTTSAFTVSFELEKSGNMKIILSDILGAEVMQIYDGFATVGTFSKTVNIEHLTTGIYFLQIFIVGEYTVAKVVVE